MSFQPPAPGTSGTHPKTGHESPHPQTPDPSASSAQKRLADEAKPEPHRTGRGRAEGRGEEGRVRARNDRGWEEVMAVVRRGASPTAAAATKGRREEEGEGEREARSGSSVRPCDRTTSFTGNRGAAALHLPAASLYGPLFHFSVVCGSLL